MNSDQDRNPRLIGLFTAISIVIANMIGTGVFTSLGYQVMGIKSGFALLSLWLVGGIFALCGALCYGELGAAMPRSGGEYLYLSKIYHPALGFLSGWVSVTVGFAAPIALAAMALGQYFAVVFPVVPPMAIALTVVIVVSLIHSQNLQLGSYFQDVFTISKLLLIVALIVCGFLLAEPQNLSFLPGAADLKAVFSAPYAVSMVFVTYAYSGWNASIYLASEVKEPEKNLPRSLLMGTAIVMVLYLLVNFIFLYGTPLAAIDALPIEEKPKVAAVAAEYIFGSVGGKIMSLLISFGLISTISSMVWAGPRVTQTIGEDIPFFKILARKNSSGIPHYAIFLQLAIVLVLTISSTFDAVTTYLGFTLTLSSFLTVLGVFVRRIRYPDAPSPYKTWGYPVTPIVFLAIALWILYFVLTQQPVESIAGLATILLGLPLYFFASKKKLVSSDSQN
ncbi:MAG: amino acid permease [Oscillatoria sp. SIO1A7]|nr:amino acid permease [Oscillatoria sp. SIO1A7]